MISDFWEDAPSTKGTECLDSAMEFQKWKQITLGGGNKLLERCQYRALLHNLSSLILGFNFLGFQYPKN